VLEISFVSRVTNAEATTTAATTTKEGDSSSSEQAALYILANVAVAACVNSACVSVCVCAENIRQSIIHNKGAHKGK